MSEQRIKTFFTDRQTAVTKGRSDVGTLVTAGYRKDPNDASTITKVFKHPSKGNTRIGFPAMTNGEQVADAYTFIDGKFGYTFGQTREKAIALAAKDPLAWLEEKESRLKDIHEQVTQAYASRMSVLSNTGVAFDQAQGLALDFAAVTHQKLMEDLNLLFPGQGTMNVANDNMTAGRTANYSLTTGGATADDDYANYKKQRRAHKVAKYNKKSAK